MQLRPRKVQLKRLNSLVCKSAELQRVAIALQLSCELFLDAFRVNLHITRYAGCKHMCLYISLSIYIYIYIYWERRARCKSSTTHASVFWIQKVEVHDVDKNAVGR